MLWHVLAVLGDMAYDEITTRGDQPVDDDAAWFVFDRFPRITGLRPT